MIRPVIDFCKEGDGFIELHSPDFTVDFIQRHRNRIERDLIKHKIPRNSWGEIYIVENEDGTNEFCPEFRPRDPEDCD